MYIYRAVGKERETNEKQKKKKNVTKIVEEKTDGNCYRLARGKGSAGRVRREKYTTFV